MDLLSELSEFYSRLISYKELLKKLYDKAFTPQFLYRFNKPYDADTESRNQIMNEMDNKRQELVRRSGVLSPSITKITGKESIVIYEFAKPRYVNIWDTGLREEFGPQTAQALNACIDCTNGAIARLREDITTGQRNEKGILIRQPEVSSSKTPKAFIAHGGKSEALERLRSFLSALGVQPVVIEDEPSEGRSINEQVERYLQQTHCAIVLGTGDDNELKDGKLYPRPNVCIEIDRFQEKFPKRIIFLLEEKASLPSNISDRIYERFTKENMEQAFLKTALELKAFGILKAVKPLEE